MPQKFEAILITRPRLIITSTKEVKVRLIAYLTFGKVLLAQLMLTINFRKRKIRLWVALLGEVSLSWDTFRLKKLLLETR